MSDTQTYDSLLDSDPYLQQKWKLERNQAFRDAIIGIIQNRFPALTEMMQQQVLSIQDPEELQRLVIQIAVASDEAAVCRIIQDIKPD